MPSIPKSQKLTVAVAFVAIFWVIQMSIRYAGLKREIDSSYMFRHRIRAVDSMTGRDIESFTLRGPTSGTPQRWSRHMGVSASSPSVMEVYGVAIDLVVYHLDAAGYDTQRVTIDRTTRESEIVVELSPTDDDTDEIQ